MEIEHIGVQLVASVALPPRRAGKRADRTPGTVQTPDFGRLAVKKADNIRTIPVADLVAEHPHHHRRMIVAGFHKLPQLPEIVGFKIRSKLIVETPGPLIIDHQAEFVAEFQRQRQDRHVRGPDDVVAETPDLPDIVFQPFPILFHRPLSPVVDRREILAEQIDLFPVQIKLPVRRPELPESESADRSGDRRIVDKNPEVQIVKPRIFRRPESGIVQGNRHASLRFPRKETPFSRIPPAPLEVRSPRRGRDLRDHFRREGFFGMIVYGIIHFDAVFADERRHKQFPDSHFRFQRETDRLPEPPLDGVSSPLGSIRVGDLFQTECRPQIADDADGQNIFPVFSRIGRIQLEGREVSFVRTQIFPVQKDLGIIAGDVEFQNNPFSLSFLFRQKEIRPVPAADIRFPLDPFPREFFVPVEGNRNSVPCGIVQIHRGEAPLLFRGIRKGGDGVFQIGKFPDPVQRAFDAEGAGRCCGTVGNRRMGNRFQPRNVPVRRRKPRRDLRGKERNGQKKGKKRQTRFHGVDSFLNQFRSGEFSQRL